LIGLREKLAPDERLIAMITRKTPETKLLIEWGGVPRGTRRGSFWRRSTAPDSATSSSAVSLALLLA
jgi:hypothetical protein